MHRLFDDILAGLKHAAVLEGLLLALVLETVALLQIGLWIWQAATWKAGPLFK